ncbi:response regulator [Hippea maritima]|uniref:Response regulator receiver protein n=1 Tax=Hippea maritima (strain ATCC 700847 / DSM 10411 / MH2) TaxID=760142 RepID=F2LTP9_HIPMA|nr:response regulator [Hippea maritima]AEA34425.1 response regulator receiver protein [Hippea maritima DSM 10411]
MADKKKIMVVDDEDAIRLLYEEEFEDEGYEVVSCASGDEAIEKFEQEKPDLVILDIAMPGMSGLDVLAKIKEKSPKTPVIMSTAYSHYKNDFYTYVADAYIVKSPDLTELKEKVTQLLG